MGRMTACGCLVVGLSLWWQCLRYIPELREALTSYRGDTQGDREQQFLTHALRDTFAVLDR